jgi:hypothetical protein
MFLVHCDISCHSYYSIFNNYKDALYYFIQEAYIPKCRYIRDCGISTDFDTIDKINQLIVLENDLYKDSIEGINGYIILEQIESLSDVKNKIM